MCPSKRTAGQRPRGRPKKITKDDDHPTAEDFNRALNGDMLLDEPPVRTANPLQLESHHPAVLAAHKVEHGEWIVGIDYSPRTAVWKRHTTREQASTLLDVIIKRAIANGIDYYESGDSNRVVRFARLTLDELAGI